MFAGGGRLPGRVAAVLAQRRRYVSVVLSGSNGTRAAFKLLVPWSAGANPKPPVDVSGPIVRVESCGGKDESRATLRIIERNAIVASADMLPAIEAWDDQVTGPSSLDHISDEEGDDAGTDEEGEAWSDEGYEAWSDEGEEVSDDELIERIPGLESKSSGEGEKLQLLGPMVSDEHHPESVKVDAKRSPRRVPSSLVADICLWPKDAVAHVTILHTNDKGDCFWKSSSCFNLGHDDFEEDPMDRPISHFEATSQYSDGKLIYTGIITDPIHDKFKVSFKTHYTINKLLGRGSEADVYECTDMEYSKTCAVKMTSCYQMLGQEPIEPLVMKELFHPNTKRLFCAWSEDREGSFDEDVSLFLAQESCKCTLEDYMNQSSSKTVTEREVVFYEIVAGIRHLHDKGFVHRDIKPNNIFIDYHGHAKVGDFGQSNLILSDSCTEGGEIFGTILYSSPEMLHKKPHSDKTDVYSLGLVYFELFISASTLHERLEKLNKLKKLMKSRKWKAGPDLAWAQSELSLGWAGNSSLLINMLKASPEDRPTCAEILEVFLPEVK